ncbi:MAG: BglII/BstYI family type II restriction endonuclease [Alphaproteobacteria bacterium]
MLKLYDVYDWRHAAVILGHVFPEEFTEICAALREFRFTQAQVTQAGGNESPIPKTFSGILRPRGWRESKLEAKLVVDERMISQDTHKIDYCKGRIAFDLEWNSKDQTFDRDLYAFRAFWEYDKISVGILVTRSIELDEYFHSLGEYDDKHGVRRRYKDKFGASTTHMGKLLPRLRAGRSGGCPVLVFGITPRLLEE